MKKFVSVLVMLIIFAAGADACVLKTLHLGVLNSTEGQVLSEVLAALINERTGTNVTIQFYENSQELYDAMEIKQLDIIVEDTDKAMQLLNKPADADLKAGYDTVKLTYANEKGLIWLKPFGFLHGSEGKGQSYTAPVIRFEVLNNFPGLPRVLDKLAGTINDETYTRLLKAVESGGKPKKVAKDFLKSKKLI